MGENELLTEWVAIVDEDKDLANLLHDLLFSFSIHAQHFSDGKQYIESDLFKARHVALIDLSLSGISGLDVIRLTIEKSSAVAVFAMALNPTISLAVKSIKAGAADVLEKPFSIEPVLSAIQPKARDASFANILKADLTKLLTNREKGVLNELLRGATSKQVARTLKISHRTVEVHRRHIFKKLEVSSVAELILLFRR
jgi:FixJ family two-component response regulator